MDKRLSHLELPPFLRDLQETQNWTELVARVFPGESYTGLERLTTPYEVFSNPTVCRLYEALYRSQRVNFIGKLAQEFSLTFDDIDEGTVVVEIGCGPGLVLLELAKLAHQRKRRLRFIGYDPSPEMIHIATENLEKTPVTDIQFICTSSQQAMGRQVLSSASLILVRNVLAWIDQPQEELKLWKEVLPDGCLILSREVRRDIPFAQFKQRMMESCQFEIADQTLYYPVKEYLAAFIRALSAVEHQKLFKDYFQGVEVKPVTSALQADGDNGNEAESQLRCYK